MTLEEKVGQLIQVRGFGDYASNEAPDLLRLKQQLRDYHIGSVDLGARMRGPNLVKGTPYQVATITNELQHTSKLPLLIGADLERGLASRLSSVPEFPYPMAFGAAGRVELTKSFARITALEARAVGLQWAFAPVADVNSNPQNPIINTRSFGEDPKQAAEFVTAFIQGAHEGGMLTTVKHFPGEGDTVTDPHARPTVISANREELTSNELVPFRSALNSSTDSVMLAQASVPALDPDPDRVAITSAPIVTGLLRDSLHFRGLIITDALEMRGLAALYPGDSNPEGRIAVDAIRAGIDIVTLPAHLDATFHAIVQAVHDGIISEVRLDQSVERVLSVKASLGLDKQRYVDVAKAREVTQVEADFAEAQRISDAAITLVRNTHEEVPIVKKQGGEGEQGATVAVLFTDSALSPLGKTLERELLARDPATQVFHLYNDGVGSDANPVSLQQALTHAHTLVLAVFATHSANRQVIMNGRSVATAGFAGAGEALFQLLLEQAPSKTVVVAFGSPYLILDHPSIASYICTYSLAKTAEVSAARGLYGQLHNQATLPVTLPGIAKRGFSLPWPTAKPQ